MSIHLTLIQILYYYHPIKLIVFICQLCIHFRFSLCSFFALVVIGLEGAGCAGSLQRGKGALGPGTVTLSRLSHPGGGLNHSPQWAPLQLAGDRK